MDHDTYVRMLPIFVSETEECLFEMDEGILALSRNPIDASARERLARAAHTVAGNAAAIRYPRMLPDAQTIELVAASTGISGIAPARLNALIRARNSLRHMLSELPVTPESTGVRSAESVEAA